MPRTWYKCLFIDGHEVFSYRDEPHPETYYYFHRDELVLLLGEEARPFALGAYGRDKEKLESDLPDLEFPMFRAKAGILRERLQVLGLGEPLMRRMFEIMNRIDTDVWEKSARDLDELDEEVVEQVQLRRDYRFEDWLEDVAEHVRLKRMGEGALDDVGYLTSLGPLHLLESMDERVVMSVVLRSVENSAEVLVDISELEQDSRWSSLDDEDDYYVGSADLGDDRGPAPAIIITEGSFDAFVLSNALALLRPHLTPYIRFLDYDMGNEGSASAAVRTLRSFAAAGITNRILALFDNDSAAYEAATGLSQPPLPKNYRVAHYPDLGLARSYPTLGPQGNSVMDVNRLAGSIELYLGTDVLAGNHGELRPVQWKGYMGKVRSYQGELVDKGAIQRAFRDKLKLAQANPEVISSQDWSGLQLVLDHLVHELSVF